MSWTINLVFSNPALENRFRRYTLKRAGVEIGGYFIASWEPQTWPGKFDRRKFKSAVWWEWENLDPTQFRFIEQVILLPNISKTPTIQWQTWNMQQTKDLIRANEILYNGQGIHFHTHPDGIPNPSSGDVDFAANWLKETGNEALMTIVTIRPLRLWTHTITYHSKDDLRHNHKNSYSVETGGFLSWHTSTLRNLIKE